MNEHPLPPTGAEGSHEAGQGRQEGERPEKAPPVPTAPLASNPAPPAGSVPAPSGWWTPAAGSASGTPPAAKPPRTQPLGPPPPQKPRRSRVVVAIGAIVAAVAVTLAVIGVGQLVNGPSTTSITSSSSGVAATPTPGSKGNSNATGPLSTSAITTKVSPGLVNINVVFGLSGGRGSATGMVLTSSGEVLTNNHVVQGATSISATSIGNGKTYTATVVGYDRTHDVAVVQLQGASGLQTVSIGDSSAVTVGQSVVALGNAGGRNGLPVTAEGSVTALDQTITAADPGGGNVQRLRGLIQTDANVRSGDSGGPLVDRTAKVIGMDAAASASYTSRPSASEGYAIPINQAISIAQQIEAGTSSSTVHIGPTAFLGVEILPGAEGNGFGGQGSAQTSGALVGGVLRGYPAESAGLAQGDVITAVDGKAVTTATKLNDLLSAYHPGDTVQIQWIDPSGQSHSATVKLASGPAA